ncbi:MAG: DUF3883 domain-containing protein [Xanthomonadales bacterium]|nr:DUF3883 domain-containing protein [Xanthomonadales bacterium]
MRLRDLSELGSEVGQPVRNAIRVIEARGGRYTHDSGHNKAPTWIYSFPSLGGAQLGLRINRKKLSVYMRADPRGHADFEARAGAWTELERHYPNAEGKKPANSLLSEEHAPYLTPERHRLLRLRVHEGQFEALLDAYLGLASNVTSSSISVEASEAAEATGTSASEHPQQADGAAQRSRVISPEQLRQQLDRQDETGRTGERIAYLDELDRLSRLGCPNPAGCVQIIATSNVAAGYDLRSEWNGERRHIEVKTTASGREDCYLSENERATLERLGPEAWLYFVQLSAPGEGAVRLRLQDPVQHFAAEQMVPVVWNVSLGALLAPSEYACSANPIRA